MRKKSETKMTRKKNKSLINLFTCYITYHSRSSSSSRRCYSCIVSYVVVISLFSFLLAVVIKIMNSILYLSNQFIFCDEKKENKMTGQPQKVVH
mgnify:CR=1 FL=1